MERDGLRSGVRQATIMGVVLVAAICGILGLMVLTM